MPKSEQVDKEEYYCEMDIPPCAAGKIEIEAEYYGQRYPAEIETPCKEVHDGAVVYAEEFVRGHGPCCSRYAEYRFLGLV